MVSGTTQLPHIENNRLSCLCATPNDGEFGSVIQDISGLPNGWVHQERDDPGGGGTHDTYFTGANSLLAVWFWELNTDGAVLGLGSSDELAGTVIVVEPSGWWNVELWSLLGPGGQPALQLNMDKAVNIRFVPEPAMFSLLALGALTALRRRRM